MSQVPPISTLLPQFSLRWFLAVVTLLTVGLGWYAWRVQRQQAVVAAIEAKAGAVWYDYEVGDDLFVTDKLKTIVPAWLRKTLGKDWFYAVTVADLNGTAANLPLDDADLERLQQLPALKKLSLRDATPITATGIRALGHVASLERIYLHHPDIQGVDLRPLRELPRLHRLTVTTPLDDAGLQVLAQCPALVELEVHGAKMTDDGVRSLRSLATLPRLDLPDYSITPDVEKELLVAIPRVVIYDISAHSWIGHPTH